MAALPLTLIFCAGNSQRFAKIAIDAGYKYGARFPSAVYFPVWFADQDWKKVDRMAYMKALEKHRPHMATVLDWEREEQLCEVLDWADEAAQYAERVLIIPKVFSSIERIPRRMGKADIVLAYSVPTKYGGTQVPTWEFAGWPIHLLGGSPHAQIQAYLHLQPIARVISADGNYAQKMATRNCQFLSDKPLKGAKNAKWPTLREAGVEINDGPYEAFRRSCKNIVALWGKIGSENHNSAIGLDARELDNERGSQPLDNFSGYEWQAVTTKPL